MSTVRFARPLMGASLIGGVAAVAAFAALLSSPPAARSQTLVSTRSEVKLCDLAFCSWDGSAPTASTFAGSFAPPGLFSLGSFIDCDGCTPQDGALFDPPGFAFGLSKLHGNAGTPSGAVSHGVGSPGGNSGSAINPGGGSSNGQGTSPEVATPATVAVPGTLNSAEIPVTANPEPGTVMLLATAIFVLVPVVRRQRRG